MGRDAQPKVVLVKRRTRLDELTARHNTRGQARFVVESRGQSFADFETEHSQYHRQLDIAREAISSLSLLQEVDREFLPNYVFGPRDVVVAIGQDGLVANTLKYLNGQPLVGVNPDRERWEGVLLPFTARDLMAAMPAVLERKAQVREVTMAKVTLNDGQTLDAVNDLFIGPRTHGSARYCIAHGKAFERQSSSGVIVSTGMGSTGWFKSLMAGAAGIYRARAGAAAAAIGDAWTFPWSDPRLAYTVREPFPSTTTAATLVHGWIGPGESLRLVSEMPENGVIFSDGIERDFLAFNAGSVATITASDRRGHLVVKRTNVFKE